MNDNERINNYREFWDFYLREHSQPLTRTLHYFGSSLAAFLLIWLIARGTWFYFPLCLLVGYGFAWFAHFVIEKNKPATFKYPLWSFISDYKMLFLFLTGKIGKETKRVLGS